MEGTPPRDPTDGSDEKLDGGMFEPDMEVKCVPAVLGVVVALVLL